MGYTFLTTATIVVKTFNPPAGDPDGFVKVTSIIDVLRHLLSGVDQNHDNISAFCFDIGCLRLVDQFGPAIAMPWYKNGNIIDYLRHNQDANRMSLIKDIASGLVYLHSIGVVHGNVQPNNILIADDGRACITDIKVNTVVLQILYPDSFLRPSTWVYRAPEELTHGARNVFTDVYAFASTTYIVYEGRPRIGNGPDAFKQGMERIAERGCEGIFEKPSGMGQGLWALLRECWQFNPVNRPAMEAVEAKLHALDMFGLA